MVVKIKSKAYKKILAYSKRMDNKEIGGLILGRVLNGNTIVDDAIILKQYYDNFNFEIKEEALMDITKNWDGKKLAKIIGWWHSHTHGDTNWSYNDSMCFKRLCDLSNFCLGIVVAFSRDTKDIELNCRLDIKSHSREYVSIDNINPIILQKKKKVIFKDFDWREIDDDIANNVEEDNRFFVPCGHCGGSGVIEVLPQIKENYVTPQEDYMTPKRWWEIGR